MKKAAIIVFILAGPGLLGAAFPPRPLAADGRDAAPEVAEPDPAKQREAPVETIARGRRGRRLSRIDAWVAGLTGDKKRIYEEYGHPSGRFRHEVMGTVTEEWVYAGRNKTFRFRGDHLLR